MKHHHIAARQRLPGALAAAALLVAGPAMADERLQLSGYAAGDIIGAVSGGGAQRARLLDKEHIQLESDLGALAGWSGARLHLSAENTAGQNPNADIGSIQGVDNIEVDRHRLRLYEAWVEMDLAGGKASVLAGLFDLNREFYATEAAGLLLGPAFGIGTELAVTGSAGPSIYPSTAPAVRLALKPSATTYARVAVLNARAGGLGDPGGVDTRFDEGALAVAEAGWDGDWRIGMGAWTYSRRQDDLFDTDPAGLPLARSGHGVYALADGPIAGEPDRPGYTRAFVRMGLSDGRTSPVSSGWEAGLHVGPVLAGRPDSAFSLGLAQAWFSPAWRAAEAAAGQPTDKVETQLELTYSDRLTPWLSVQPDVQYLHNPGGVRGAGDAVVLGLRLIAAFGP